MIFTFKAYNPQYYTFVDPTMAPVEIDGKEIIKISVKSTTYLNANNKVTKLLKNWGIERERIDLVKVEER